MEKTQSTPSFEDSILNDEMVREETVERLKAHLPVEAKGYKANTEVILEVVILDSSRTAVTGSSIQASCQELAVDISGNTVREHLNEQLTSDSLANLEAHVNDALQDKLPRRARRGKHEIAIDLRDQSCWTV